MRVWVQGIDDGERENKQKNCAHPTPTTSATLLCIKKNIWLLSMRGNLPFTNQIKYLNNNTVVIKRIKMMSVELAGWVPLPQ